VSTIAAFVGLALLLLVDVFFVGWAFGWWVDLGWIG
jgi:hypothetical protein